MVDGKKPLDKYLKYREMSINNPNSDTMTLGKYEPTILPDGTPDYSIPGHGAYIQKAGDTTYFRARVHRRLSTSFRQILLHTALKILAIRKYACKFLPCLQKNLLENPHIFPMNTSSKSFSYDKAPLLPENWKRGRFVPICLTCKFL